MCSALLLHLFLRCKRTVNQLSVFFIVFTQAGSAGTVVTTSQEEEILLSMETRSRKRLMNDQPSTGDSSDDERHPADEYVICDTFVSALEQKTSDCSAVK